ncbi:MAG: hypothetical protein ACREMP_00425 [Candidatus Tyrphobacter sp.]
MEAYASSVDVCLNSIERDEENAAAARVAANALLASRIGHHDAAEAWFNVAIEHAHDVEAKAALVYRSSLELVRRGRTECTSRLEQFADVPSTLRAAINATLATAHIMADRAPEAMRFASRARDILTTDAESAQRARTLYQIAFVAMRTGQFEDAKTFSREAVESARRHKDHDIAARGYSLLYELAHHIDCDPRAALRYVELVESCAAESGDEMVRAWATMTGLYIDIEAGNLAGARARERALRAVDIVQSVDLGSSTLVPAQAMRCAWRRDFAQAYRLVAESGETQPAPELRAYRFAEAALYAAAAGEIENARVAIESAEWALSHSQSSMPKARVTSLAYCALASALAVGVESAESKIARLESVADEVPATMDALIAAVRAIYDYWCGVENHAELLDAFAVLHEQYFGGISMLFEALPVPS